MTATVKLRELRKGKFTQEELAELIGCKQEQLSRLEAGAFARVDLSLLLRICVALGVTMAELVPLPTPTPKRRR